MSWKVKIEPTEEPVSLETLKAHLRVQHDLEDALIIEYGKAARVYIEQLTDQTLVTQTILEYLEVFPSDAITLTVPNVTSIIAIKYIPVDSDNLDYVTWDATNYRKDVINRNARIVPKKGLCFPVINQQEWQNIEIEYTAGYESAEKVPSNFKLAIMLLVAEMYEIRQNRVHKLPTTVEHLLKPEMNFVFL